MLGLAVTANPPTQWHAYLSAFPPPPPLCFLLHFTWMNRDLSELIAFYYHKGGDFVTAANYTSEICY